MSRSRARARRVLGAVAVALATASFLVLGRARPDFPLATNTLYGTLPPAAVEYSSLGLGVASAAASAAAAAFRTGRRDLRILLGTLAFVSACAAVGLAQVLVWRLTHPVSMP